MEQLISDDIRKEITKRFDALENPVKIVYFTQKHECDYCKETHQLLEEVSGLSDKISLQVLDFVENKDLAEKYKIDKIPATIIMNGEDHGIRLYGIPSGYEFSTLLEDIVMVSKRDSMLSPDAKELLSKVQEPVHIQVFVTPTCPYCPQAVLLAHQFALENDKITADMVEATEFPHLVQRYGVMGVPKTVANDQDAAEGALPELNFLERVLQAASQK